jgi:hypothetical protein
MATPPELEGHTARWVLLVVIIVALVGLKKERRPVLDAFFV